MGKAPKLSASIDASETDAGWVVSLSLLDGEGRELHRQISDPVESEDAYWRIGNRQQSLANVGIPVSLTERATSLCGWWDTDRFVVLYQSYGNEEREEEPTLERAWRTADEISEYGSGYVYEIRSVEDNRLLYSRLEPMKGWVREADDMPPVEDLESAIKT